MSSFIANIWTENRKIQFAFFVNRPITMNKFKYFFLNIILVAHTLPKELNMGLAREEEKMKKQDKTTIRNNKKRELKKYRRRKTKTVS